jgi:hypothetical protein
MRMSQCFKAQVVINKLLNEALMAIVGLKFEVGKTYSDRCDNKYLLVDILADKDCLVFYDLREKHLINRCSNGRESIYHRTLEDIVSEYKPRETAKFYINIHQHGSVNLWESKEDAYFYRDDRIECLEITTGENILEIKRV